MLSRACSPLLWPGGTEKNKDKPVTRYNVGGPESHPAIFQLNTPKPQGRRRLSLHSQYPLNRAPTCKALGVWLPDTVRKVAMSCNSPSGPYNGVGKTNMWKHQRFDNNVGKQWKAVTILIVGLKWMIKDQRKKAVFLVPPQVKSVGSAFPFLPTPPASIGHMQCGQGQFLPLPNPNPAAPW